MSPVITGVVSPIESKINSILGVPLLSGIATLNTNASGLLSAAASGAPITLKVLSNSGTVLSSTDTCYSQADAITLTNPAGISIGGNQITGLGDNGTVASAGELNSIAFGNGAGTNAAATGSIAIGKAASIGVAGVNSVALGNTASATAANSVALGANSIASRGANSNYNALGLGALQSSAGEVSVGKAGSTRQITNLAAGSAATDAVNVAQLQGVSDTVTALDNIVVKYDSTLKTNITLGGTGGTTITNVHAGNIAANSTDAINGSQLFATNTNVANNTGSINALNSSVNNNTTNITNNSNAIAINTSAIVNLTNNISNGGIGPVLYANLATPTTPNGGTKTNDLTLVGAANGGVRLHNVANGVVSVSSTDAVNGSQLFQVGDQVSNLANLVVQYDNSSKIQVTFGGVGSPVTLTNVAAGNLGANSKDAVNGSQLFATNTNVTSNTNAIASINTDITNNANAINTINTNISNQSTQIANNATSITNLTSNIVNGALGPVQYSNNGTPLTPNGGFPSNDLTLVGLVQGSVRLHNVANGVVAAGSSDAVTGDQLFATNTNVTSNSNAIVTLNTNIAVNTTAITNLRSDTENGAIGILQYANNGAPLTPNGGTISNDAVLIGANGNTVQVHNVANGVVSVNSTDAINGSQLFALTSSLGSMSNLALLYDDSNFNHVTLGGLGAPAVTITNLAAANLSANSTDAVNGSQLFATNANVTNNTNSINLLNSNVNNNTTQINTNTTNIAINNTAINTLRSDVANGAVGVLVYSDHGTPATPNGGTISNDVVLLGANSGGVLIHNVAGGDISVNSTDAVNGSQLFATNTNVTNNSNSISLLNSNVTNNTNSISLLNSNVTNNTNSINVLNNTVNNLSVDIANGGVGPVQYADSSAPTLPNGGTPSNDVTIVGGSAGAVRVHNVANGIVASGSTDAVNGSQLYTTNINVANIQNDVNNQNTIISNISSNVTNNTNAINLLSNNVTNNTTAISNLSTNISNGGVGPVQYSDAGTPETANGGLPSQDLTLIGVNPGAVNLHNIANGRVALGSYDAVNGGQLFGMGSSIANALGVTYNSTNNSFSANFSYGGNNYTSVQNVFNAIQTTINNTPGINGNEKYFHANSVAVDSQATGVDSTAIGPNAQASGEAAIASGRDSVASGDGSVAIGDTATAKDGKAVSIGFANTASGDGAVAIGDPNFATGLGAIALGKDNTATGDGATALGNTNSAMGDGAVAIGLANQSSGLGAAAFGNQNAATGDGALALGSMNVASGDGALAFGWNNTAAGDGSLAIGSDVSTTAADTLAIGSDAGASAVAAAAVGNRATAGGTRSSAFGNDAFAQQDASSAFGNGAEAFGVSATAVGSSALSGNAYTTAVGESTAATGEGATALGSTSDASGREATAIGIGAIASADRSVALGSASETTRGASNGYSAFGLSGSQSSVGEIAVRANIALVDPISGVVSPVGDRQITGVAAGSAGTDAVNVSQLRGVSNNIGNVVANSLGGGATYNSATGIITGPSYTVYGNSYSNVGDAISALASSGGSGGSGGGTGTDPNAVHYTDNSQAVIALGGTNGTTISNVAAGEVSTTSTDAVNGAQLQATNDKIDQVQSKVENGSIGAVQYSDASSPATPNGGTKTNDVTLVGAQNAPVAVHNVADGVIAAGSTDAINGGQIAALNTAVSDAHQQAAAAMAQAQNTVQYDDETHTSVTLGSTLAAASLHNVADGTSARDAVNLGQLNAAVSQANQYTDNKIAAISFDLRNVRKDANAGTAAALAAAGMPQAYEPGKGMLAFGAGSFQGQTAIAAGFSKAFDDGHTVMKVSAAYNSRNKVGVSAGIGFQF